MLRSRHICKDYISKGSWMYHNSFNKYLCKGKFVLVYLLLVFLLNSFSNVFCLWGEELVQSTKAFGECEQIKKEKWHDFGIIKQSFIYP